jgi:hypothetical protein
MQNALTDNLTYYMPDLTGFPVFGDEVFAVVGTRRKEKETSRVLV